MNSDTRFIDRSLPVERGVVPWRPGKAAIDYFLVAGLARAEIRSGRVEAPMIAAAVVLGALIDIGAAAIEHHVAVVTTAHKSTVEVVAVVLATRTRALVIIEAGALVGSESVAHVADALVGAKRVAAVLAATAIQPGALVHILAMSPVRQIEAHAAVARVVAGVVRAVLRAAPVVERTFVHVLTSVHILSESISRLAAAAIANPADDFTEVIAGTTAAGIRCEGRRGYYRLTPKKDCRYCH
jgi:hypothetical protein